MRRNLFATGVLISMLAALVLSAIVRADAPGDSVIGGGWGFTLHVTSGPSGENASGRLIIRNGPDYYFEVDLVCLSVSGNVAGIGGVVTDSHIPEAVGITMILVVQDNGPSRHSDQSDMWLVGNTGVYVDPMSCATFPATYGQDVSPIDRGNLVVSDAP